MRLLSILLILSYAQIRAQEIIPIDQIGIDPDDSFEDLFQIGSDIGNSSVVVLQDWASADDGASYDAIGRLIHYLHQEKGFDVLMWHLGTFEGRLMDEGFKENDLKRGLDTMYKVWRESSSMQKLAQYACQSHMDENPLMMVGNSCQFHGYGKNKLVDYLVTNKESLGLNKLTDVRREKLDALWTRPKRIKDLSEEEVDQLRELILELNDDLPERTARLIQNMLWFVELERLRAFASPDQRTELIGKFREETTNKNLEWMLENELKGRKIILFGGLKLPENYPGNSFTIGITGYTGKLARPGQTIRTLEPTDENTIEKFLADKDHPLVYVRGLESTVFTTRLPGEGARDYDGIVFIKEVYPNF